MSESARVRSSRPCASGSRPDLPHRGARGKRRDLGGPKAVVGKSLGLFGSGKLDGAAQRDTRHGVAKIDVLEALSFPDVIIVGNIDAEWATIGGESDDLKGGEIWCQEVLFFHVFWPRELRNNSLRVGYEGCELLRLFLVDDCYPTFPVGSGIFRVNI